MKKKESRRREQRGREWGKEKGRREEIIYSQISLTVSQGPAFLEPPLWANISERTVSSFQENENTCSQPTSSFHENSTDEMNINDNV